MNRQLAIFMTLLLGGCLGLCNALMTQTVVDALPSYPESGSFKYERSDLLSFMTRDLDFRAPPTSRQSNLNQRYLVYVDRANSLRLKKVQQLEPDAFMRQYQGKYVIQVGIFNHEADAKKRVRELRSRGIGSVIVSLSSKQATELGQRNSKFYFVVIPSSRGELPLLHERVKRLRADAFDSTVIVSQREQPLGPHVRVGPFLEREQAERWNRYLRKMGVRHGRVYYGF